MKTILLTLAALIVIAILGFILLVAVAFAVAGWIMKEFGE